MNFLRIFDKTGAVGIIAASLSCASCFPALAALGTSIGLGFLTQYEGFFLNTLIPLAAWIVLASNLISWWSHRVWWRTLIAISGPIMVLATFHLFWTDNWSTGMFYIAIGLMFIVSIWDVFSTPKKQSEGCKIRMELE